MDEDPEARNMGEVGYISVDAILDEFDCMGIILPVYIKCAIHAFNLVARIKTNKALNSASFKSA